MTFSQRNIIMALFIVCLRTVTLLFIATFKLQIAGLCHLILINQIKLNTLKLNYKGEMADFSPSLSM